MKVLSVRQPWAWLICVGLKDVENRSRRTNYRGKILVHSPAKFDYRGFRCFTEAQVVAFAAKFHKKSEYLKNGWPYSCIIGSVEIIDCVKGFDSIWSEPDSWHWLLKDAVLFDKPVLNVPGKLGIWNYEGEL